MRRIHRYVPRASANRASLPLLRPLRRTSTHWPTATVQASGRAASPRGARGGARAALASAYSGGAGRVRSRQRPGAPQSQHRASTSHRVLRRRFRRFGARLWGRRDHFRGEGGWHRQLATTRRELSWTRDSRPTSYACAARSTAPAGRGRGWWPDRGSGRRQPAARPG
jgi:hypothetical protein